MTAYFQRLGKRIKPYHLLHGMFALIIIAGIIYRLLKK